MSDYEKLCAFYDYVCENVTYDYDNLENAEYKLKYSAYTASSIKRQFARDIQT